MDNTTCLRDAVFDARIILFAGHFGSGKSEVALNFALAMRQRHDRVAFADMDIVNPFFRTTDAENILKHADIRLVRMLYANTNVDVPALPPEMSALFDDRTLRLVLDIGGDDLGARVISRYHRELARAGENTALYVVVNVRRPETATPEGIRRMLADISLAARMPVSGLVNNTHLLKASSPQILAEGQDMIGKVAIQTGIPLAFTAGLPVALAGMEDKIRAETRYGGLVLSRMIRTPWAADQ